MTAKTIYTCNIQNVNGKNEDFNDRKTYFSLC